MDEPPSVLSIHWSTADQVAVTVIHSIAISCSVIRLFYRCYTRFFWYEDAFAALALLWDGICVFTVWTVWSNVYEGMSKLILSYFGLVAVVTVVWSCRLSILCSIIRLAMPGTRQRRVAIAVTGISLAAFLALVAVNVHVCSETGCRMNDSVWVTQLITDVASDCSLISLPIWILCNASLARRKRGIVLAILVMGILTSAAGILHIVFLVSAPLASERILMGELKAGFSLIIANLMVLGMLVWRLVSRAKKQNWDGDEALFSTVDLDQLTSGVNTYDWELGLSAFTFPAASARGDGVMQDVSFRKIVV